MNKNTISIIILLVILFAGYWTYFVNGKSEENSSGITRETSPKDEDTNRFIASLLRGSKVENIKIDKSIFENPNFVRLNYPNVPFVLQLPTDVGRANPFSPIGQDTGTPAFTNPPTSSGTTSASTSVVVPTQSKVVATSSENTKPKPKNSNL